MNRPPVLRASFDDEINVDLFAGGGGASVGIEAADRIRFRSHVRVAAGDSCWEWQGYRLKRPSGALSYGLFCVGKRQFLAHRMAWILSHGDIPDGSVVRHRCDNVACVRPDHLLIGTQAQNLQDMRERGRAFYNTFPKGTRHHSAKIDPERVLAIRKMREAGVSLAKIGSAFGLHPSTVHAIVRGRCWGHVT